jgi:ribosomal protein S18 acetylase RimI-like enzyme
MIYLIGGAPRAGKSILGQQLSAKLGIGGISTDLIQEVLQVNNHNGSKAEWNAAPEAIIATAERFFPYLERFVWGVSSMAESYVIEGVNFLPRQVSELDRQYQIRTLFIGCSDMTLERFDQFPGRSIGYTFLPEAMRRQMVHDVPLWSEFIRQEASRSGYPYVDMSDDFPARLHEAEALLLADTVPEKRGKSEQGQTTSKDRRFDTVRVRPYVPADQTFVLSLAPRLAIGIQPWRDLRLWLTTVENWLTESINQHGQKTMVWIAEDEQGERCGFATVSHSKHFTGQPQAYIGELATSETVEGRGVGTALVEACQGWAREQGYTILTLSTGAANARALRFYRHLGFQDEDVTLTKLL